MKLEDLQAPIPGTVTSPAYWRQGVDRSNGRFALVSEGRPSDAAALEEPSLHKSAIGAGTR
jgi:hypothetical protein